MVSEPAGHQMILRDKDPEVANVLPVKDFQPPATLSLLNNLAAPD